MPKTAPTISICIPTFNGESTIRKVLDTLSATSSDCEVVISDDLSTDNTFSIVNRQKKCSLIKFSKQQKPWNGW